MTEEGKQRLRIMLDHPMLGCLSLLDWPLSYIWLGENMFWYEWGIIFLKQAIHHDNTFKCKHTVQICK